MLTVSQGQAADFFELARQAMTQGTLGTQFLKQFFGLGEDLIVEHATLEETPPTLSDFFFGKQA